MTRLLPPPAHPVSPALPVLALLTLSACNSGFTPQYLVEDLRILAVRSSVAGSGAADADLGDTLVLSALVANPRGRAYAVSWYGCAPTADQTLPPCLDPDVLRDPASLETRPGIIPLGTGETLTLDLAQPEISGPLAAAFAELVERARTEPAYACSLYTEIPVVVVARGDGRAEAAVKRVRLSPQREVQDDPALEDAYVLNFNPGIDGVRADALDGESCAGGVPIVRRCTSAAECDGLACGADGLCAAPLEPGLRALCARPAAGAAGTFNQCAPDGTRTAYQESLEWQWYVTAGRFDGFDMGVGNATGGKVDFERPAGPFTMWIIVRDRRGGEAWLGRSFP